MPRAPGGRERRQLGHHVPTEWARPAAGSLVVWLLLHDYRVGPYADEAVG